MVEISETFIEDIAPRYEGDRVRDYIIPGTFPRKVTEIRMYEDTDRICMDCYRCGNEYTILAGLWQRLYRSTGGQVLCYRCYRRAQNYHAARTLAYISGQCNYLNDEGEVA